MNGKPKGNYTSWRFLKQYDVNYKIYLADGYWINIYDSESIVTKGSKNGNHQLEIISYLL